MDYTEFLKKVRSVVVKENRGAIKLSSKEKRKERRENRYKAARVKERNMRRERLVREKIEERRQLAVLTSTTETDRE